MSIGRPSGLAVVSPVTEQAPAVAESSRHPRSDIARSNGTVSWSGTESPTTSSEGTDGEISGIRVAATEMHATVTSDTGIAAAA